VQTIPPAVTTPGPAAPVPTARGATALPGLALLAGLAVLATAVSVVVPFISPLVAAVAIGAIVVNVWPVPETLGPGVAFGSRSLLRLGIVLLGFRLSIGDVVALGVPGLAVVISVVSATFWGTRAIGRRLGLPEDLGLLVATGYSICGASAIAAMNGVVHAEEEETAYAIALVTLCGTLSILVLPVVAGWTGLAGEAFGTWVGGSVHDVGQVVATASQDGSVAVAAATVVKLTRVVLLAPLVAFVALRRRALAGPAVAAGSDSAEDRRPPLLPLFVVGFLAAIVARSTGLVPAAALEHIATVEKLVLTLALVGLGMGVHVGRLRRLGGRPLLLGLLAWPLVAGVAYAGTALVT
jgi:uncharacterized integral membrane protein (TIGR00698 family)